MTPSSLRLARLVPYVDIGIESIVFVAIAGSVLAFGAVHPWAYRALWCACGAAGIALALRVACIQALRRRSHGRAMVMLSPRRQRAGGRSDPFWRLDLGRPALPRPPLLWPGLAFVLLVGFQLLPLGPSGGPLTFSPADSARGLAFVLALLALHVAAALVLSWPSSRERLSRGLALLGTVLALVALLQEAAGATRIYGLFEPWESTSFFGPFVNKNHFAGYMLMLVPIAFERLRYAWRGYARRVGSAPGLRRRLVALETREGLALLYSLLPTVTLAGLIATLSRGAILALVVSAALAGLILFRRKSAPGWALGCAGLLMVVGWVGLERLDARFSTTARDAPGRTLVWLDTLERMKGHWLTGTGFNTFGEAMGRALPWDLPRGATPWPTVVTAAVAEGRWPGVRVPSGVAGVGWRREAHNDYVQVLAETGLAGLVIVLWAAVAALMAARSRGWLLASVAGILLHALVDFDFQIPAISVLFVTLVAWPRSPSATSHTGRLRTAPGATA